MNRRKVCPECGFAATNVVGHRARVHGVAALSPDDPRHGKPSTYHNYGCSCDLCKTAYALQMAEMRRRRPDMAARGREQVKRRARLVYAIVNSVEACQCDHCRSIVEAAQP